MHVSEIIKWLKKNFTASVIGVIVSSFALWFTYKTYSESHGGKIVPVIYEKEIENPNQSIFICITNDSIKKQDPQLTFKFKNISNYTLEGFKIQYVLRFPAYIVHPILYEANPEFESPKRLIKDENDNMCFEFNYRNEHFLSGDVSPDFFKYFAFVPYTDSIHVQKWFDVDMRVTWNKHNPIQYKTRIYYNVYPDSIWGDSSEMFYLWSRNIYYDFKNIIGDNSVDVMLLYHRYEDSLFAKGIFTRTYDVTKDYLDTIISITDSVIFSSKKQSLSEEQLSIINDFLTKHQYYSEKKDQHKQYFDLVETIIGFLLVIIATLLMIPIFREWKDFPRIGKFLWGGGVMYCYPVSYLCVRNFIISVVGDISQSVADIIINYIGVILSIVVFSSSAWYLYKRVIKQRIKINTDWDKYIFPLGLCAFVAYLCFLFINYLLLHY